MTQTRRFLVVAPVGRDGELICGVLKGAGYPADSALSLIGLDPLDSTQLLGLILTDEALTRGGLDFLRHVVDTQPQWSDIPVLLLTSAASVPGYAAMVSRVRLEIRSLFLLDRPVRKELLISAIQVVYHARLKQLEVRDAATRQSHSDEALRNSEKLATVGRLAATMAHEVNNPLEALSNLLFLVENCTSAEEAKAYGRLASQELERISEIVDHTLRFHRAPAKPMLNDVSELTFSALALFRPKLRERQISEYIQAPEGVLAFCSAGEIRQAIVNLIGNALDAMPSGGRLRVKVSRVNTSGADLVRVTIADTGSGIQRAIRSNLFTQFFTTKGSRGTGLGLWLTRDIVQRNGGHLRFRSRTDAPSGTVFTLYLPAHGTSNEREALRDEQWSPAASRA